MPPPTSTFRYCWTINWVPFAAPTGEEPLLFDPGEREVQPSPALNSTLVPQSLATAKAEGGEGSRGGRRQLSAQTYIERLELGEVVDLVILNPSRMVHPMHLHGGRLGREISP